MIGVPEEAFFEREKAERLHGRIPISDGLRIISAGPDHDPEKIGIRMPEMTVDFKNEGIAEKHRSGQI